MELILKQVQEQALELVEETFTRFGKVVGFILAPGFSHETNVANALIAKAENVCNHFKAMTVIDVPSTVVKPTDAKTFKDNLSSPHAVIVWLGELWKPDSLVE